MVTQSRLQMRAAVLEKPYHFAICSVPLPSPQAGEVRVKVESCGVCVSNLAPWEGRPWFRYPFAPGALGHEGTGRIELLGEGVTDWQIGERVALLSQSSYAEFEVVRADRMVRLPSRLDGFVFPGEPLGCVMNIMERADVQPGERVAVVGVGFLGALLVQQALLRGAQVVCTGRRLSTLQLASRWGAQTVVWNEGSREEMVRDFARKNEEALFPLVFETTGAQEPLHLAGELPAERGKLVIAGYHQDGLREVNLQLWNWRGLDVINAHERDPQKYLTGMRKAVEASQQGNLDLSELLTHFLPLEELSRGMQLTRDRPDRFMKAVVVMS